MLRFLLWRLLGLIAVLVLLASARWLLDGGLGAVLRGAMTSSGAPGSHGSSESRAPGSGVANTGNSGFATPNAAASSASSPGRLALDSLPRTLEGEANATWGWSPGGVLLTKFIAVTALLLGALVALVRGRARRQRRYVRMRVQTYRTDQAGAEAVIAMFEVLHKRLLRRWWRRLLQGQPTIALEVHHSGGQRWLQPAARSGRSGGHRRFPFSSEVSEGTGLDGAVGHPVAGSAWLAVTCPVGMEGMVEAALRTAYPNCRLVSELRLPGPFSAVLRLKKRSAFIRRAKGLDLFEHEREPAMNRLMTVMGACASDVFVQIALTPTPALFEHHAKRLYKRHEAHLSRERRDHLEIRDRSMVEDSELRGGLDVQHRPLFFVDLRVIAPTRDQCEQIASELRAGEAENRLVERGTAVRHGLFACYTRRVRRGEGNPLPSFHKGVFASTELAAIWHLPSVDYSTVPFARGVLPVAPAPPAILRPADGVGTLRDALGAVSIHPRMRKQNTAVPGTVEQGKSSYLVATVAEDLLRERCSVIMLDPKGDAAEAAVSLVPAGRTCTLLDLAHPTCGFNPLAVEAPADVIADYVVAALKNLFTDDNVILPL